MRFNTLELQYDGNDSLSTNSTRPLFYQLAKSYDVSCLNVAYLVSVAHIVAVKPINAQTMVLIVLMQRPGKATYIHYSL